MSSFFRLGLAALFTIAVFLFPACTTSPETDDFGVEPGFVYNDTAFITTKWGLCKNATRTVSYWGLSSVKANGDTISRNWVGVSLSTMDVVSATFSVGTNGSDQDAESPAGKASILMFRVAGSLESPTARLRVSLFAGGDSVRVEGKNIVLQNGKTLNFNLTNTVSCKV